MPSPVGHLLGGAIVALLAAPDIAKRLTRQEGRQGHEGHAGQWGPFKTPSARAYVGVCLVAACLPDIDFAWGRHNMETHSIGFALLVALLVYAGTRSRQLTAAAALAVGTHVLFDWLGSDDFPPLGVMALWPFSSDFYFADAYVFATISRRYWLPGFVTHNVLAVLRELVLLLPIVGLAYWYRVRGELRRTQRLTGEMRRRGGP